MIDAAEVERLKGYLDIVELAEHFGADQLTRAGRRWRCCCFWHQERTPSLVLYPDANDYHCYGCGAHGDVIKMAQHCLGFEWLDTLRWLARRSGYWPEGLSESDGEPPKPRQVPERKPAPRNKPDGRIKWQVVTPVPARVPEPRLGTFETYLHSAKAVVAPVAFWVYRDQVGQVLGADVRYEYTKRPKDDAYNVGDLVEINGDRGIVEGTTRTGLVQVAGMAGQQPAEQLRLVRKDVITWTWCKHVETAEQSWRMKAWPDPSPLYGLDRMAQRPDDTICLAEGCKAAEAANQRTGLVGMTWRGGSDATVDFARVDWSPLAGRDVLIWPDADEPGRKAAWHIAQHLRRIEAARIRVVSTADLPKGWDLAD